MKEMMTNEREREISGPFGYTYFAENWKYCNKIIFKCVNSAVRPIFNENFVEKRGLVGLMNSTWDLLNSAISVEILLSKR